MLERFPNLCHLWFLWKLHQLNQLYRNSRKCFCVSKNQIPLAHETRLCLAASQPTVCVYLPIHDACIPLQSWCPESAWSCCGLNRSIQSVGGWWRWWWEMWPITRAAVVDQHKAGNHGNNDDATNPLALERHKAVWLESSKVGHKVCNCYDSGQLSCCRLKVRCENKKTAH